MSSVGFVVTPRMQVLLKDIGVSPVGALRRAGLPDDLFNRGSLSLSTSEWFQLWLGIEAEAANPTLPLAIGQAISFESFDPTIFAALCSPDLITAFARLGRYKKLCVPQELRVDARSTGTRLEVRWLDAEMKPPPMVVLTELVFLVQLARLATREKVCPRKVTSPVVPKREADYTRFFGVPLQRSEHPSLLFSAGDALRPLLTANEEMWKFFEPHLQKRLSVLEGTVSTTERVRGALLELLPSGDSSIDSVCRRLAISRRTLQRRLNEDGSTYQSVLDDTRMQLASHYLKTQLSTAEISFLLGFEDPNSFFRAFRSWTGKTPEQARLASTA